MSRDEEAQSRKGLSGLSPGIVHFVSGSMAGMCGVVVGHPLDTVRVHMQTSRPGKYRNVLHCGVSLVRSPSGIRTLYRGMATPFAGVSVFKGIAFGAFGNVCRLLKGENQERELRLTEIAFAGATAGLLNTIPLAPVDRVKILLQTQPKRIGLEGQEIPHGVYPRPAKGAKIVYRGPLHAVRMVVAEQGPRGMFRGTGVTAMREFVGYGSYYWIWEYLRRGAFFHKYLDHSGQPPFLLSLVAGGFAGCFCWSAMYPIDIVKSRKQRERTPKGTSALQLIKQIYAEGGIIAFYKGWSAAMIRGFPVHATVLIVYDVLSRRL